MQLKDIQNAPEFPPKKVRNLNPKVIEQRRKGLEKYIQVSCVQLEFNIVFT